MVHNTDKKPFFTKPGLLLSILMLVLTVGFCVLLAASQLLPTKLLVPVFVVLALILLVLIFLLANHTRRSRFITGVVLSVLLAILLLMGGITLQRSTSALSYITGTGHQMDHVGVYVLKDDPAQSIEDAVDYRFGILSGNDRGNVDKTIEKINSELDVKLHVKLFDSMPQLLDALFSGEVQSIVIKDAYLPLLDEMDGYTDAADKLRQIYQAEFREELEQNVHLHDYEADSPAFTVYISGIDTHGDVSVKSRSDVNILATINPETHQVLLVSTPRDYFVPLPISNGIPDKLTHAGIYGVDVSMGTIGMIYDIDVDYFFRVNFSGFEEIIDQLGGVNVYSDYDFSTGEYSFNAGENYLNGSEALAFARCRYAFAAGDRQRGRNQMAVIQAVINKALSPELLKNYNGILSAVEGNFETSVPYKLVAQLVRDQLRDGGSWNVQTYSVDGYGDSQIPYSMNMYAYVMIPDQATIDTAKELMQQVRDGEVITMPE